MKRDSFFLDNLPTGPNLSHAVRAGNTLYLAGQVALTTDRQVVGEDDPLAQSEEVFRNIEAVLAASGASCADIVKLTCYVSRPDVYAHYAQVRSRYLLPNRPAETALLVGTMLDPRLLLEVEVVAVIDEEASDAVSSRGGPEPAP
jgi:enamine deaminase RidA (YjgF/YER057c/UK114 family)